MAGATSVPREKQTQDGCLSVLKRARCWRMTTQSGGYGGLTGAPDILACYRGYFLAIEVKRDLADSKLTPSQKLQLELIQNAGGLAVVARRREDAQQAVDAIDRLCEGDRSMFDFLNARLGNERVAKR